jgi:hypothetical protein
MIDLKKALVEQSDKRGRFDTTTVRRWLITYSDFLGKDEFPSEMMQHWFWSIDKMSVSLDGTSNLQDIAFEWGMGDKRNIMIAQKNYV